MWNFAQAVATKRNWGQRFNPRVAFDQTKLPTQTLGSHQGWDGPEPQWMDCAWYQVGGDLFDFIKLE
eukprot:12210050-Karenia_brevis.AAC.1